MATEQIKQKAHNFALNDMSYGDYDVPKSPIEIAEESYIAGATEKCMCCDKVGKWRNYNGINEKLAQSYKKENEQLQNKLNNAVECIKNMEKENKKLEHSLNLAERLVNMIPKIEYMPKEHKELVVLEAEQYIKGIR